MWVCSYTCLSFLTDILWLSCDCTTPVCLFSWIPVNTVWVYSYTCLSFLMNTFEYQCAPVLVSLFSWIPLNVMWMHFCTCLSFLLLTVTWNEILTPSAGRKRNKKKGVGVGELGDHWKPRREGVSRIRLLLNRRSSEIQGTALGKSLWAWTCISRSSTE